MQIVDQLNPQAADTCLSHKRLGSFGQVRDDLGMPVKAVYWKCLKFEVS